MNGQSSHLSVLDDPSAESAQGEDQPSPDFVASLLEKFYSRSATLPPNEIAKINTLLVQVQARNTSLDLPEKLLQSSSPQVRFFAAVLLGDLPRRLPDSASAEKKQLLADKYVKYAVYGITAGYGPLEYAKLCRACVSLYIAIREWPDCFRQFMRELFGDDAAEYERLSRLERQGKKTPDSLPAHDADQSFRQLMSDDPCHPVQALLNKMDDAKAVLLITFMGSLVESLDPEAIDLPDIEKAKVNDSFISTCQSLMPVMSGLLNRQSLLKTRYSPSIVFAMILKHKVFESSSSAIDVENKVEYLAQPLWLQSLSKMSGFDGTFWTTFEPVVDSVFRLHRSWVGKDTLNSLVDHAVEPNSGLLAHARRSVESQEQLDLQLSARRMCKDIALQALEARLVETDRSQAFLQLTEFMATSFEIDEECEWAGQVVLFWNDYAEYIQRTFGTDTEECDDKTLGLLLQPMVAAMTFIYPRLTIPEDPDDELRENIVDVQLDAHGLFAQAYNIFNGKIGQKHGSNPVPAIIMQTEPQFAHYGLASPELVLRTLSGVSEYIIPHTSNDLAVCRVLETRLFDPIHNSYDMVVPLKSREVDASIDFLEQYAPMLARNPPYLIKSVEFLFSILDTDMNAHDPEIGKAMKSLCLSGRTHLIPKFQNLVNRYQELQNQGIYFPEAKVDVIASLGIVGYAADLENKNLVAISSVIKIIQEEVEMFLSLPDPEEDTFEQDGLDCLKSILELGALVRSGSSRATAILLDDEDKPWQEKPDEQIKTHAVELQGLITNLMSTLAGSALLRSNEDALRSIWDILRLSQGTKQTDGHMAIFTFGPGIYQEVLELCINRGAGTDYALETFGVMVASTYTKDADQSFKMIARKGFAICMQYMGACTGADDGGDSLNGPLKLLLVYIETCDDIIAEIAPDFGMIAGMVTPAIGSANLFTQEAACDIWRTILRGSGPLLDHVGQPQLEVLALAVTAQISGDVLERAIPHLSAVLAAMGARGGPCKAALEAAFRHLEAQGVKVANWSRLVNQIFMLRGNPQDTRRVTEQYWRADRLAKAQLDGVDELEEEEEATISLTD